MKFIDRIIKRLGISQRECGRILDIASPVICHAKKRGKGLSIVTLCKWRILSGLSWSDFGGELDREYLTATDKRRINARLRKIKKDKS